MIVYADVFFIENFIVNLFLLSVTMRCLKHKSPFFLLLTAAFIGAIYSFVMIIPKLNFLAIMPFELLTAYLMIRVSYGKTTFINMLKVLGAFLMLTLTLSGICFFIFIKTKLLYVKWEF